MNITDLKPGQKGQIVAMNVESTLKNKLLELGLTPGTFVQFVRTAPLGDPINIKVRGFNLGIRRAVAQCIELK